MHVGRRSFGEACKTLQRASSTLDREQRFPEIESGRAPIESTFHYAVVNGQDNIKLCFVLLWVSGVSLQLHVFILLGDMKGLTP